MNVSEPQGNGSVSYSSVLHFTPTLAHDGKELGCTVTYPAVGVSTRRALRLHVSSQLSQGQVYQIHVAPHVTVQQGLCVLLPCHFIANFESPGPVYKYWFLKGADKDHGVPVASTNPDRPPQAPRGRICLAGEAENDCSLSISDVRAEDREHYYFRFEKGEWKYSYLEIQPLVNVTELRDQPVLRVPEVLKHGQPVNVTCQAPGTCSGTPPQITWTGGFNSTAMNVSEPQGNGSVSYSSVLRFTPTLVHDGKELSCTVTYPAVGESTRRALRLHVGYAPELLPGGNCTVRGSGPGGAATCYCAAEGNPPPRLQWLLPNRTVPGDFEGPELRANSWVQGRDVSGELRGPAGALVNVSCVATNAHGESQTELPIVPAGDDNFLLIVSCGVTGGILLLLILAIVVCKVARARKDTEEGPSSYDNGGNREQQPSPYGEKPSKAKKKEQFNLYKASAGGEPPELSSDDYVNMEQVEDDENSAGGGDGVYENIGNWQPHLPSDQIYCSVYS
ncbi:sialic acid-binding Ig-like lectin 13 [Pelodiscus sinensis]|uniref:sialic acid-binding Ig-like lectin 13 n=1 Tax=Pelodiscus sinensis TaxID=13735 RepID=UPI003F6D5332